MASPSELVGAMPSDSAPTTLPRRRAGSTFAVGTALSTFWSAAMVASLDSARFGRPTTTTTGPLASLRGDVGVGDRRPHGVVLSARLRGGRSSRQYRDIPVSTARELDNLAPALLCCVAQAEIENRQLFFQIRAEQHDGRSVGRLVDRCSLLTEDLDRQSVAELCVAVWRVDRISESGPRRRRPHSSLARHRESQCSRAPGAEGFVDECGRRCHRAVPLRLDESCVGADHRIGDPVIRAGGFEIEAAAVAQPAVS